MSDEVQPRDPKVHRCGACSEGRHADCSEWCHCDHRPLVVAIVGSRDFDRLELVVAYVKALPKGTMVISGGARGVDRIATVTAYNVGLPIRVWYPDWQGPACKGAGFARNTLIVDQADRVVAFWDGKSRGTIDTVQKALKARKHVEVHMPSPDPKDVGYQTLSWDPAGQEPDALAEIWEPALGVGIKAAP